MADQKASKSRKGRKIGRSKRAGEWKSKVTSRERIARERGWKGPSYGVGVK